MVVQKREADSPKSRKLIVGLYKDRKILIIFLLVLLAVLFISIYVSLSRDQTRRTESYREVTGSAGLNAKIEYDCKENCYSFNVYIFNKDGQQVSVLQPSPDGYVRLAMSEGDYMMLIGKKMGNSDVFPQESMTLKNGQELELNLKY
jgi:hypothetical protein